MIKIKKYQMIKFLEIFKEEECNTINDVIELLNKELKNDDDIVITVKEGK